eukprot:6514430-Pyramimonas_sp.AAC.1
MASGAESESSDGEGDVESEGVDADGGEGLVDVEEMEVEWAGDGGSVGDGAGELPSAITMESSREHVVRVPRPQRDAVIDFSRD